LREGRRIAWRIEKSLRGHCGVLSVVARHSAPEQEPMPHWIAERSFRAAGRNAFARQSEGVPPPPPPGIRLRRDRYAARRCAGPVSRPGPELMAAWKKYVAALRQSTNPKVYEQLCDEILDRAEEVAQAAGGFLGMASVSSGERAVLVDLEKTLRG
jgi:hypothetical protein